MILSAAGTITNEDVREFRRLLQEEDKHLTPEKARQSLIASGVLDQDGKPRWPVKATRTGSRKKKSTSVK